jgi:CRP-like cAMP-binding protein
MKDPIQVNMLKQVYEMLSAYVAMDMTEFQRMVPYLEFRTFKKKDLILQVGEVDPYFNLVAVGLVRKYLNIGKKEVTLQLATEGHYIHSELSFFRGIPSTVNLEALESSVLISITRSHMEALYLLGPVFERLGRMMINDMFIRKDYRYYVQLKYNTNERFLRYMEHHADMLQRVPQKYLASYLNIKPETFSRLKHLMRKKKTSSTH